ncbi:MAG: hypothetical protein GC192_20005 [Bacteroidetes bacterium]|nr:hypothetical protein [Bacteroidota bacterium]
MWLEDFIKPENESTDSWHKEEVQQLLDRYYNGEKNANMCKMLMMFYRMRGDEQNARRFGNEMIERLNEEKPSDPEYFKWEYYHNMGRLNVFYQRWDAAVSNYQEALKQDEVMETYFEMAGCYCYLKDMKNAEKYGLLALEKSKEDDDEPNYMWKDIGRLLASNKKFKEAIEIFSEYAKYNPTEWYPLYCIGQCWQDLGDQYRALAYYQKVLAIKPNSPHVLNNLGALAINEDARIQEGIDLLKQALEHIENESALKTTILINLSRAYAQLTDYEQAEYYKMLMLQNLGFPVEMVEEDDDEEDDENEAYDEEEPETEF